MIQHFDTIETSRNKRGLPSATPVLTATPAVTLQGSAPLENAAGILPGQGSLSIQGLAFGQSLRTLSASNASPDGSVTVIYTYDALNRLTAADYSNGDYFHYTYDGVGNRLSQESSLGGTQVSTEYTYDDANRLTGAGGVTYTWDNNGNLLSDGTNTYTYDGANRLVGVVTGSSTVTYAYDGMGNRLQQTENGVTTTYTLDLAGSLSQVLSDGTNTYLYGNGRIAQENAQGRQYFLGDSLGSVRQLVDENGLVTLAKRYDPYGNVIQSVGEGESAFGFTGEDQDTTNNLIYLRARYYSTGQSRFLSKDSWKGNYELPETLNSYAYGVNNPVLYTDPTGNNPGIIEAILIPALVGAGAGFSAGYIAGGIYGACIYELALAGKCGCEMQKQASSMTRQDWISVHALGAGIIGGVGGAVSVLGPIGMIAIGTAGVVISGIDILKTYNIIKNETGLTSCTITRLIVDVVSMAFSSTGIIEGVRAWRSSGSVLEWQSARPPRNPNDVDRENNRPTPPRANDGNGVIGSSPTQFADVNKWVDLVNSMNAEDIRVDQEMVNAQGVHVGRNRPDLQFSLNDERYYVEWDTPSSGRGMGHALRIQSNDPKATGILQLTGPNYSMPN
jgi:RHS repeat-associated protein